MQGQMHHTFDMAKSANVTRVSRNPNNKQGSIVVLDNGDTLWLQTSYIQSVLESNYIDDARPTALIGSEVSYEMKAYKAGDLVFDKNGVVAAGETTKFSTTSARPIKIRFGDISGHTTDYDKALMLSKAVANAMVKNAGAFAPKPKTIAEPATSAELVVEGVDAGEPTI